MEKGGEKMYRSYYKSPMGEIKIEANKEKVVAIEFTDCEQIVDNANEITKKCEKQLEEYFLGKRKIFEVFFELEGTEFQKKVWSEVDKIPYGKTVSYKEIAKKIGNEKAVRAVGTAIGKNPIAIIVPCHRVIGSDGKMTGYAYGIERKVRLLELEKRGSGV